VSAVVTVNLFYDTVFFLFFNFLFLFIYYNTDARTERILWLDKLTFLLYFKRSRYYQKL